MPHEPFPCRLASPAPGPCSRWRLLAGACGRVSRGFRPSAAWQEDPSSPAALSSSFLGGRWLAHLSGCQRGISWSQVAQQTVPARAASRAWVPLAYLCCCIGIGTNVAEKNTPALKFDGSMLPRHNTMTIIHHAAFGVDHHFCAGTNLLFAVGLARALSACGAKSLLQLSDAYSKPKIARRDTTGAFTCAKSFLSPKVTC